VTSSSVEWLFSIAGAIISELENGFEKPGFCRFLKNLKKPQKS